jgi:hypothetical protein
MALLRTSGCQYKYRSSNQLIKYSFVSAKGLEKGKNLVHVSWAWGWATAYFWSYVGENL